MTKQEITQAIAKLRTLDIPSDLKANNLDLLIVGLNELDKRISDDRLIQTVTGLVNSLLND